MFLNAYDELTIKVSVFTVGILQRYKFDVWKDCIRNVCTKKLIRERFTLGRFPQRFLPNPLKLTTNLCKIPTVIAETWTVYKTSF